METQHQGHQVSIRGFASQGKRPDQVWCSRWKSLQSTNFIWGILKTHRIACELIVSEIKNHKIVTGTYSSWLVANSGRKKATTALEHSKALEKKIDSLEKKLSEATSLAAAAKKTADKAFNKNG